MNTSDKEIHILHLSDLHLGQLEGRDKEDSKQKLDKAFESFFPIIKEEKIDFIVVSGDISYRNKKVGFSLGEYFIRKILGSEKEDTKLSNVFICPGNHDLDQPRLKKILTEMDCKPEQRGAILGKEDSIKSLNEAFQDYNFFCTSLIKPYNKEKDFEDSSCFTYGFRIVNNICFLMLNSAWFSTGGKVENPENKAILYSNDLENLFLGKSLVEKVIKAIEEQAKAEGKNLDDFLRVTLVHHPPNWLNWTEKYVNDRRTKLRSAWDRVIEFSDIILTGHEHIELKKPSFVHHSSLLFQAGATYVKPEADDDFHPNHICLLKIKPYEFSVTRKLFSYEGDIKLGKAVWRASEEERLCLSDHGRCGTLDQCEKDCDFHKYYYRPISQSNGISESRRSSISNSMQPKASDEGDGEIMKPLRNLRFSTAGIGQKRSVVHQEKIPVEVFVPNIWFTLEGHKIKLSREKSYEDLQNEVRGEILSSLKGKLLSSKNKREQFIEILIKLDFTSFLLSKEVELGSLIALKDQLSDIVYSIVYELNLESKEVEIRNLFLSTPVHTVIEFNVME